VPVVKLTQTFVDKLRAPHPGGKQVIYLDTVTKGFGVQVSGTTTAIDYIAQRELPRKVRGAKRQTRRVNIGPTSSGLLGIQVARERAEDVLDQIRRGIDPKAKGEPEAMYTLGETKQRYFTANKKLSAGSKRAYGQIDRYLADWLDKPLSSITPEMVEVRHQKIANDIAQGGRYDGKATANATMVTLRVLWRWAAKRIALPACPVRGFLKVGAAPRVNIIWLKVLCNHALSADVTAEHYLAPDVEDLREPAQQVCEKMLALCSVEPVVGGNVAKLR